MTNWLRRFVGLIGLALFAFAAHQAIASASSRHTETMEHIKLWVGDLSGHPLLSVSREGSLEARRADDTRAPGEKLDAQLSGNELQILIELMVEENEFLSLDESTIQKEISEAKTGSLFVAPADARVSVIEFCTIKECHRVAVSASSFFAAQLPDVVSLQKYRSVEEALLALHSRALSSAPPIIE